MRCPQCGNEEEFVHFYLAWLTGLVLYENGEVKDHHNREMDIDTTKEIICNKCKFTALPEVFKPDTPKWREVIRGEDGRYYIEHEEVGYWHTTVEGNLFLCDRDADIYIRLKKIYETNATGDLAEMLVHDHPAVRNAAKDKMNELLFFFAQVKEDDKI